MFSSGQNRAEAAVSPTSECALKGFLGWVFGLGFFHFPLLPFICNETSHQKNTGSISKNLEGLFSPEGRACDFSPSLYSGEREHKKGDIKN